MKNIKCPEGHKDTYEIPQNELVDLKNKGYVEQRIYGLLGCNACEDFYELTNNNTINVECDCGTHEEIINGVVVYHEKCYTI